MNSFYSLCSKAVTAVFLTVFIASVFHAQGQTKYQLDEDFNSLRFRDWYIANSSYPLPKIDDSWLLRPNEPLVGAEYGSDGIVSWMQSVTGAKTHLSDYAAVGYSQADHDGAKISKWLISPMLYNVKNGDVIKFKTRAQPQNNELDNAFNLLSLNAESLAKCNRPNRMEIRFNRHYSFGGVPTDSINFGSGPDDVGHFDMLLHTINPSLTKEGYPQNWTEVSVVISGLPSNQRYSGRIGFRYYLNNGGYDNCQSRLDFPPGVEEIGTTAISQAGGTYADLALFASKYILTKAIPQVGTEGTYIGLDDVQYIPNPKVFMTDGTNWDREGPQYYWNSANISNGPHVSVGYPSVKDCNPPGYPYPQDRRFYVWNYESDSVTFTPNLTGATLEMVDATPQKIGPGDVAVFDVEMKDGLSWGSYYGTFWVTNGSAATVASVDIDVHVTTPDKPEAYCKLETFSFNLNGAQYLDVDPNQFNGGSKNSCGWYGGMEYKLWPSSRLTCEYLGEQTFQLEAYDTRSGKSDYCPVQISTSTTLPYIVPHTQTYYLSSSTYQGSMPKDSIHTPHYTGSCDIDPILSYYTKGGVTWPYDPLDHYKPGEYTLHWAIPIGNNAATGTTTLIVRDTLKPQANCADTVRLGHNYILLGNEYSDQLSYGMVGRNAVEAKYLDGTQWHSSYNNNQSWDNTSKDPLTNFPKIGSAVQYRMYTDWKGISSWQTSVSMGCEDAGEVFDAILEVSDYYGNSDQCSTVVKIEDPVDISCKDVTIEIDQIHPWDYSGYKTIQADDLLEVQGLARCLTGEATVSKSTFTCADVNTTVPVEVTYTNAANEETTCTSNVTVTEFAVPQTSCADTIYYSITDGYATHQFNPQVNSICSDDLSWHISSSSPTWFGGYNETFTGSQWLRFYPGISHVHRFTDYLGERYECRQVINVVDTVPPKIKQGFEDPEDVSYQFPSLYGCTKEHHVENPFELFSYVEWRVEMTGATEDTKVLYEYDPSYWLGMDVDLYAGVTHLRIVAKDGTGLESAVEYDVDVYVQTPHPPIVWSTEFENEYITYGNFCDENADIWIDSPMDVPCNQTGYMWYYEVRDAYLGNILFERDSIPQDSGAYIPLKVNPQYYNNNQTRTIHFGYHHKEWGHRVYSRNQNKLVIDTIDRVICPNDTTIEANNTTDYTADYLLEAPLATDCDGSFWGYAVSGATIVKSADSYSGLNANQTDAVNRHTLDDVPPSISGSQDVTLPLNVGLNTIDLRVLEESGNLPMYDDKECSFNVTVVDVSTPVLNCPPDVTLNRSDAGSCEVEVASACGQVAGFSGYYGPSGLRNQGANSSVAIDRTGTPDNIQFKTSRSVTNNGDAYINIEVNCAGTVSFDWEYKSEYPGFFRPFALHNGYEGGAYQQTLLSGIDSYSSAVQSGSFSATVADGDIVSIGVMEGGYVSGYFKISNFTAPHADPFASITAPTFTHHGDVSFSANVETSYGIGEHTATYSLYNENNGNEATCEQTITVLDDFAASLVCSDQTLYLDRLGLALLDLDDIVSTCFPIGSTTLSRDTFDCASVGAHVVTVTAVDHNDDTLTCDFNVTISDTTPPAVRRTGVELSLDYFNNATLTDSILRTFFSDNCGIETLTASRTSFTCEDVGAVPVEVTATDSTGNSTTVEILVESYPLGFNFHDPDRIDSVCVGEYVQLSANQSHPDQSLLYEWQVKQDQKQDWGWHYYTCEPHKLVEGGSWHKFHRIPISENYDNTYMAYSYANGIGFKALNPTRSTWNPVFDTIPVTIKNNTTVKGNLTLSHFKQDYSPYTTFLDNTGAMRVYRYSGGFWGEITGSLFFTVNQDFNDLYTGDDYYFAVKWNGIVYAAKEWNSVSNLSQYWNLYRPSQNAFSTYVSNARNIVGIRNELNQNVFFSLNIDPTAKHITGKDSLTVDPTSNSDLFEMEWFNDAAHIAYKSATGKATVKKYDGSNTWSIVGSADFSEGTISRINMREVEDTLYVLYAEANDTLHVQRLVNGQWEELRDPGRYATNYGVELQDISGDLGFYIHSHPSTSPHSKLITHQPWVTAGVGSSVYSVDTSEPSDETYRCVATKSGCSSNPSGEQRIIVKEIPQIVVSDTAVMSSVPVTISAQATAGTPQWTGGSDGSPWLGSGTSFTTPTLHQDLEYFVYADNNPCYSDTVNMTVSYVDTEFPEFILSYSDTLCYDESVDVEIDSGGSAFGYKLYQLGEDGRYFDYAYENWAITDPFKGPSAGWGGSMTETTTFKIYQQELNYDAAQIYPGSTYNTERLDFGQMTLPIEDEVTIETWVYVRYSTSAYSSLAHLFINGNNQSSFEDRNWAWDNGKFLVYNGSTERALSFPSLPATDQWIHVATTAGPDGMAIYYDGVEVASNNLTAEGNINANHASMSYGMQMAGIKVSGVHGVDEFRVWTRQRSETEIASQMNTCLDGDEFGLVIYHNFSEFDEATRTFSSVVGNNVTHTDLTRDDFNSRWVRNETCADDYISGRFYEPFTIHVLENQPVITSTEDYYSESEECGGEMVEVVAKASSGIVSWYDSYEKDSLLGTGDTLRFFATEEMNVYAQPESQCSGEGVRIEVMGAPAILSASIDTVCYGEYMEDVDFDVDYNNYMEDYYIYDAQTGGSQIGGEGGPGPGGPGEPGEGEGEEEGEDRVYETDTLWLEAYNEYCVAEERVQVILPVKPPIEVLSTTDTTLCGSGDAVFFATGNGTDIYWRTTDDSWIGSGDSLIIEGLTSDTTVVAWAGDDDCDNSETGMNATATILPVPSRFDTVIVCDSYTWRDGLTYTSTDNSIVYTKSNASGCDSVYYLNLSVINIPQADLANVTQGVCVGGTASVDIVLSAPGYQYSLRDTSDNSIIDGPLAGNGGSLTLTTPALSDTIGVEVIAERTVTLGTHSKTCSDVVSDVVVFNVGAVNSYKTIVKCESYTWNGLTYTTSGNYTKTLTSVNGCDSIAHLDLTINFQDTLVTTVTACETYTWNDSTYEASTTDSYTSSGGVSGCGIVHLLELTIIHGTTGDTTAFACNSFDWYGTTYDATGQYEHTLTAANGCDSVVTLDLTIDSGVTGDTTATSCGSFDWYGNTYLLTGSYEHALTSSTGCDSVVTLNLTVNSASEGDTTAVSCSDFTWYDNTYDASGIYKDTLTNAAGCDSVVTLNLTIPNLTSDTTASACDSFDWYGSTYNTSGDYNRTVTSSHGCDSVITLHLTINETNSGVATLGACEEYYWEASGFTYTSSGTYYVTTTNSAGCDSAVTLNLTIGSGITGDTSAIVCDQATFDWYGQELTTSGDYTHTLTTTGGCDSVVTLSLVMGNSATGDTTATACDAFTWYGAEYTTSGDYTKTLSTSLGCDSVVTLALTINNSTTGDTSATACDAFTWYGVEYTTTGDYTKTLSTTAGCDSVVTLALTINSSNTGDTTATACDAFTWYGTEYTASGDYNKTLTNAAGCDSVVTLALTIMSSTTGDTTATACDAFTWYGTEYTTTGDYDKTLTAANGCDSVVTLALTINNSTTGDTSATACDAFTWYGTEYTTSGDYDKTLSTTAGCDSVVTLALTINNSTTGDTSATACDAFTWYGTEYTTSGDYNKTLSTTAGCDSVVTLALTINNSTTGDTTATACDAFTWYGVEYTTSGDYDKTLSTTAGCDSVVTLALTIKSSTTGDTAATACDAFTWYGTEYTTSGDYNKTLTAVNGCDSVVTLALTINNSATSDTSATACDAFTWYGTEYTTSGDYSKTLSTTAGCDSMVTLSLTINSSATSDTSATACDAFTWYGTEYTTSGDYSKTLSTTAGCDSVVTLALTINSSATSDTSATACDAFTWYGTEYTTSGDYNKTLSTTAGCDSVVTLSLTINSSATSDTSATACDAFTWYGTEYTTSGDYTKTLSTTAGCDSVVTLALTINSSATSDTSATACDAFTWYGTEYTTSGDYTKTLSTTAGCDSVVTLALTINNSTTGDTTATACDAFTWYGVEYTTSGDYTKTLNTSAGCDSVVTLALTINNSRAGDTVATACDAFTWYGTEYTTSGDYTKTLSTTAGCDSVVTLALTINNSTTGDTSATACDAFTWYGTEYTTSGDYTKTLSTTAGCDSVVTLALTINNSTTGDTTATACDAFVWYGTEYTASGDYAKTLSTTSGCDSVVTLALTINTNTTGDTAAVSCDAFTWYGTAYTTSGDYTKTLSTTAGCDSVVTLALTINNSTTGDTSATACDAFTWYGVEYTTTGDYSKTLSTTAGCDSVVTLSLTINNSTTGDTTATACDAYTWYGTEYTTSGDYTKTLSTTAGCDSVVTLALTINSSTTGDTTATACDAFVWYGTEYTASGDYAKTLSTTSGCDSVVTLSLTINTSTTGDTAAVSCDAFTWYGTAYSTSGDYTKTLSTTAGCDSVVTLALTINNSATGDTTATSCEAFAWYGNSYSTSGDYNKTLSTANGCDSVLTLHLTVITIDTGVDNITEGLQSKQDNAEYEWINCEDEDIWGSDQLLIPSTLQPYKVKVTYEGCVDTSDCHTHGVITADPNHLESGFSFQVYPNPARDWMTLEFDYVIAEAHVHIEDDLGRVVRQVQVSGQQTIQIDMVGLARGVYHLFVTPPDMDPRSVKIVKMD